MVEVACYNLSIYYLSTRQYSTREIIDTTFEYHSENNYFYTPYKIPKILKTKTIVYASIRYYLVYAIFEQHIMH